MSSIPRREGMDERRPRDRRLRAVDDRRVRSSSQVGSAATDNLIPFAGFFRCEARRRCDGGDEAPHQHGNSGAVTNDWGMAPRLQRASPTRHTSAELLIQGRVVMILKGCNGYSCRRAEGADAGARWGHHAATSAEARDKLVRRRGRGSCGVTRREVAAPARGCGDGHYEEDAGDTRGAGFQKHDPDPGAAPRRAPAIRSHSSGESRVREQSVIPSMRGRARAPEESRDGA